MMSMKNILDTLASTFCSGLKKMAVELIVKAESDLPGATGAAKRAFVVEKLDALVALPWYLEALDGPLFGVLVDVICDKLNLLTDHEKILVAGAEEKAAAAVEATDEELQAEGTVDDKLNALYEKYKV